jgi:hypothetical protein
LAGEGERLAAGAGRGFEAHCGSRHWVGVARDGV